MSTVLNMGYPSLDRGTLEISLTVPLRVNYRANKENKTTVAILMNKKY